MRAKLARGIAAMLLALLLGGAPALAGFQVGAADPAPAAGPGMVPAGQWRLGLSTTWQSSERFKDTIENAQESDGSQGSENSRDIKLRDDRLHMFSLAYGLHRRLTAQIRLGMVEGGKLVETLSNGQWEAKLKSAFVWDLGLRGLLWEHPSGLGLTAGLSYLRYDDRGIDFWHYTTGWTTDQSRYGVDGQVDYWRLQAEALAHWRLGRLLPYLGLSYTYSEIKDTDTWSRPDGTWSRYDFSTTNQDRWGLLGGLQVDLGYNLSLGLNFALVNRQEAGLSLAYTF